MFQFLALVVALFALWTAYLNIRPKGYPPGPFVWPLVGVFPQLYRYNGAKFWQYLFTEWGQVYGKIFYVRLGPQAAVVINDSKLIKEAFNNPLLCGRPGSLPIRERTGGVQRGILFNDGDEWHEQRRFALRHLRDFGFGKTSMENMILDEVSEFIERLKKDAGKPIATQNRFNIAVLNALWTITSGQRLSQDDPELQEIIAAITRNVQTSFAGLAATFFPSLVLAFPRLTGYNEFKKDLSYTYDYLTKFTKERVANYDEGSQENFSETYIQEIRKTSDPKSSFYGRRGELTMTAVLQDLFVAGAETTSTTLSWACLYLSLFPDKQKKLLAEIDEVLKNKEPSLEDRPSMPYTEAFIMETLRFSSMVPLSLAHSAVEDVKLGGYFIPKDTWVMANLYSVHYSKEIWGDAENFRPERFLNPDGTCMGKHDALMAFSFGKRLCLGESLAKNELFLFIACLFKQFSVTWDPNNPKPTLEAVDGPVVSPQPHKLVFAERHIE